jgi:hypothetical protein
MPVFILSRGGFPLFAPRKNYCLGDQKQDITFSSKSLKVTSAQQSVPKEHRDNAPDGWALRLCVFGVDSESGKKSVM